MRKYALTCCGLIVGGYCAYAAFRFNAAMAVGQDGYVFAGVMAAMTVGTWLLLPVAVQRWQERAKVESALWGIGWMIAMALVLVNSAGFTATGRREAATSKVAAIEAYRRADSDYKRLTTELETAKVSPRWEKTAGCTTNLVADASKVFCDQVERLRNGIQAAEATLDLGRPSDSGANVQAEILARVTGMRVETISVALPIVTTLILELMANVFMLAAATAGRPVKAIDPELTSRPRLRIVPSEPEPTPIKQPDLATVKTMNEIRSKLKKLQKA